MSLYDSFLHIYYKHIPACSTDVIHDPKELFLPIASGSVTIRIVESVGVKNTHQLV